MQGLHSQVLQQVRDRVSSPTLQILGPAFQPDIGGNKSRAYSSLLTLSGLACGPHAPHSVPDLLCCAGQVQGPLSQVLQQVRGKTSSPTLMNSGASSLDSYAGKGRVEISPSPKMMQSREVQCYLMCSRRPAPCALIMNGSCVMLPR